MSFNEKLSYTEFVVETPTTDFNIGFSFTEGIDKLGLLIDDVDATEAGYTYHLKNSMTLEVTPPIASGTVRIYRETNLDTTRHVFKAAAKFVAANMDTNFTQILHSQQETRDGFDKLAGDVYPLVDGLEVALEKADEAAQAAQEAADAAEEAAQVTRSASQVNDASGETQQQVNYNGGSKWHSRVGGYQENERVVLTNGDIVKSTLDGNTNDPNVDMTGWVNVNSASQVFDESGKSQQEVNNGIRSVDDLRLINPKEKGVRLYLVSVNEGQGEGGGTFVTTQKAGLIDNGGTIIASANPLIFWVRVNYETSTPEMFGAKVNDSSFDSYDAIQRCFNNSVEVKLGGGIYFTSKGLKVPDALRKLTGVTQETTVIKKTTLATELIDEIEVDYILRFDMTDVEANYYKKFSDFSLSKLNVVTTDWTGYGVYADRVALSQFSNIRITHLLKGIYVRDSWMVQWDRVTCHACNGWEIDTGTSNVFSACWTISVSGICYKFRNLLYSTMISCGADFSGTDGNPAEKLFDIYYSEITIVGMGYEKSHLEKFAYIHQSRVTIIGMRGLNIYNKYQEGSLAWLDIAAGATVNIINSNFGLMYSRSSGVANVPRALWIRGDSTYREQDSSLFVTYQRSDLDTLSSNVVVDNPLRKFEHFGRADTEKEVKTNRILRSNNGYAVEMNPDAIVDNGFYYYNAAGSAMSYAMLIHANHRNDSKYGWQIGVTAGSNDMKALRVRMKNNDVWTPAYNLLSQANTTVDANGFIKNASPIIKLFSDHIEKNDEVSVDVSFVKLGVGDYLIKNTEGFSTDGWYVELPQDANGNKLFAVAYEQLVNGDISVKTYKKKFDLETASIVADLNNPVDITESRWVDLRLHKVQEILDIPAHPEEV